MKNLIVYTSQPASGQMATFMQAVAQNMDVRPVSQLPAPDPVRRQALRVERIELRDGIKLAEFSLEQYRSGAWQPDAGHESGLRFDLDALNRRLSGLNTVLGTEEGGADNA